MNFDDYLLTKEAEILFCSKDSANYNLYKKIWDDAQKNKKGKKSVKKNK